MRHRDDTRKGSAEKTVRDIRRATRRRFASEEKIRTVLAGLRGEDSIDPDSRDQYTLERVRSKVITNLGNLTTESKRAVEMPPPTAGSRILTVAE